MADKKISELTELTTPDGTEELVVNDSGTSKKITQTNLLSTALPLAGGTMTGNLSLGDNVKAKFGASDDLQIYHDGGSSYIKDGGTGALTIDATDFYVKNGANTKTYIQALDGGAVSLRYNDATRFATTNNGVDVTGSVTCDGFTSTGIDDNATSTKITVADTGIDVTGSVTSDGLTVNDTGGASISYGYSLINSSARNGSGSIQLSGIPSIAMLLDYYDADQTVATVRNTYGATSPLAELALDSGFITFNIGTSFTEAMRITSAGNVGIGTSSPADKLTVSGNISNGSGNINCGSLTSSILLNSTGSLSVSGDSYTGTINGGGATGNFHLDTQSATTGVYLNWFGGNAGTFCGNGASGYGNINASAFNVSSDYRLKENIVPMAGSIARLKSLKPCNFNFIAGNPLSSSWGTSTVDGFIAHEVQEVVPECATGTKDGMKDEEYEVTPAVKEVLDDEGNVTTEAVEAVMSTRSVPDYQGIDQSKLVPLLVASLQEAVAKIEALEARVTALEV